MHAEKMSWVVKARIVREALASFPSTTHMQLRESVLAISYCPWKCIISVNCPLQLSHKVMTAHVLKWLPKLYLLCKPCREIQSARQDSHVGGQPLV